MECTQTIRLPIYEISAGILTRSIAASLLTGIASGLIFSLVLYPILSGILYIGSMAGLGYLISESINIVSQQKRGRKLQLVATSGVIIALALTIYINPVVGIYELVGAGLALYVAIFRLR